MITSDLPAEVRYLTRASTPIGAVVPSEGLAWGLKAPSRAFIEKVLEVAEDVGTNPSWLMTQFWGESGFNPQAHLNKKGGSMVSSTDPTTINKNTIGGGMFGLMKQWAKPALGVDFYDFMAMTDLEQLEVARQFYKKAKGKLRSMEDVFCYTFWPAALGKKDSYVLMRQGDGVYEQNSQMDVRKVGYITKGDAASLRRAKYQEGMRDVNRLDALTDFPDKTGSVFPYEDGVPVIPVYQPIALSKHIIGRASPQNPLAKPRMLKGNREEILAYVQRLLTEQAILTFVVEDLTENAETEEDEDLLESLEPLVLSNDEIEKLRKAEHTHLKFQKGKEKSYLLTLFRLKDALKEEESFEGYLAWMAVSELLFMQEQAEQELVAVAFQAEDIEELVEEWEDHLLDACDMEDDSLDLPLFG